MSAREVLARRGRDDVTAACLRLERDLDPGPSRVLVECEVDGLPVTQGSTRIRRSRRTGAAYVTHDKATQLAAWRDAVAWSVRGAYGPQGPCDGPVLLEVVFYLPRPVSVPRSRPWPHTKPDLDKLLRAIGDALMAAGVLAEDSRVVATRTAKRYTDACPGVTGPGIALRVSQLLPPTDSPKDLEK